MTALITRSSPILERKMDTILHLIEYITIILLSLIFIILLIKSFNGLKKRNLFNFFRNENKKTVFKNRLKSKK